MKKIIGYNKIQFIYLTIVIMMRQLLLVLAQQTNANMFNSLVDKHTHNFIWVIVSMSIIWIFIISLDAFIKIKQENFSLGIQQKIRVDLSSRMTELFFQDYSSISSGKYLSWMNNDINIISQKGIKQYFSLVQGSSGVLFAAVAIIQYHWSLLVFTFIGFIGMLYIPKLFDDKVKQISKEVSAANEKFVSDVENQINGYPVYFAFSSLFYFIYRINLASEYLNKIIKKQIKIDTALMAVNFSVNVFFQILLTIVATICYFHGWVMLGAVAIIGSLADIIFSGLGDISYQLSSIKSISPILDKFENFSEEEIEYVNLIDDSAILYAEKLNLSYNGESVFKDVSFCIKENDKCLLHGISGSGKSSLLNLLLGYNHSFTGVLKYKGIDVQAISSKQLSQDIIYVSQQSYIFDGDVRENIDLGSGFTKDEIEHVLLKVGFKDNISELLNMQASKLSGGQKQRVALARALIRNPKVLICDEITSALDKDSAKYIEHLLLSQDNLTVIMVTHTLYTDRKMFDILIQL